MLIGVDEVSRGADHKFLTCVADHQRGAIVWATEVATPPACRRSSTSSRTSRKASIKAVSIDMSAGYENAIRSEQGLPHAAGVL